MGCGAGEREVRGLHGGCWWVGGGGEARSCGRLSVVVFCVAWLLSSRSALVSFPLGHFAEPSVSACSSSFFGILDIFRIPTGTL